MKPKTRLSCNTFAAMSRINFSRSSETVSPKCCLHPHTSATVSLVRPTADAEYVFGIEETYKDQDQLAPEEIWITARQGDLPCPLRLRLEKGRGGRIVVTGLEMLGEGSEITSETLRAIRLPKIIAALFAGFDAGRPPPYPEAELDDDDEAPLPAAHAAYLDHMLFKTFIHDVLPESSDLTEDSGRLAVFALTYQRNLAAHPSRAMTATAEDLHLSRATANRRAAECRRRGLLPMKGSERP